MCLTFSSRHPASCQVTATPTACWESWWARARGRWRIRRRESSASGRGRRSWRNAPAPRRCYPPGVSRWPRSNRRLSTRCGTSTLCCEYSRLTSIRKLAAVKCVWRGGFTVSFASRWRTKLWFMWPVQHIVISPVEDKASRCLLSVFTHRQESSIHDFPVFWLFIVPQWSRWCPQWPLTSWHMVRNILDVTVLMIFIIFRSLYVRWI